MHCKLNELWNLIKKKKNKIVSQNTSPVAKKVMQGIHSQLTCAHPV